MTTVRLRFLIKELNIIKLWNAWTRKTIVSTAVKKCLKDRSVREVIQCFKYTILRPRRLLVLSAVAASKYEDESDKSCSNSISDDELQALLLELENVQKLSKMTLYCASCGKRLMIDRKQEGVQYCGCKESRTCDDSSEGWIPYMETDDVIIWRKEYKPGKGLYAYKVYGRYPEISASDYAAVQIDGAYRRIWDSAVAALSVVERNAQGVVGQAVLHWEVLWPRLFANRDYVFIRRHKEFEQNGRKKDKSHSSGVHSNAKRKSMESYSNSNNKVFVIVSKSCEHPDVPETKQAIRVSEYWSHMVVRTMEGADKCGTEFVLTYYDEPATGGMSCGVAAWASSRAAPAYLARMRRAARDYRAWAASRDTQDLPDFVPLSPEQVNEKDDCTAIEEQDMETSKQGPEMENGRTTRDQSTQTDLDELAKDTNSDENTKDSEVRDKESPDEGRTIYKKSTHEEENEKSQEEDTNNGWWRYLHPFYYFV